MFSVHWFGAFLITRITSTVLVLALVQGSASTRYLLDNGIEIVKSIDLPWNNEVYAMEPDKRDPSFIIMSDHVKIKMVSRDGNTKRLIAGSDVGYREGVGEASMFSVMASFVQLNESIIVVADSNNHCLRSINREFLNTTAPFSGRCNSSGYQDGGSLTNTQYSNPCGLALSGKKLFVADSTNNAIRIVDLASMAVSTLLGGDGRLIKPRYILLDSAGFMLVSLQNGGIVNVGTSGTLTTLTSQQPGYKDGSLRSASFGECKGMSWMESSVALISDYGNNRIRIINLLESKVSTLCRRPSGDGNESDCRFQGVFSVLVENVTTLVSGSSSVKRYDIFPTDELLPSTSIATSVSALLPSVISGIVIALAIAVTTAVVICWRRKESSKRRRVPPFDEPLSNNPNCGRPLPKPIEEEESYASMNELGMIPSETIHPDPKKDRASSYESEPLMYSYASLPDNSLMISQTEQEPTVSSSSHYLDSSPLSDDMY